MGYDLFAFDAQRMVMPNATLLIASLVHAMFSEVGGF